VKVPIGELIVPFLSVNFMTEPSGYFGSLESLTSADATATPPVVATMVMCNLSCPPGIVGLTLSSSHGDGAGVAELQSTPTKYVAFADSSPLTSSVTLVPFQDPANGPGFAWLIDVVGAGAAVRAGAAACELVGVGAFADAETLGDVATDAGVTAPLEALPQAATNTSATDAASTTAKRVVMSSLPQGNTRTAMNPTRKP
jgi:hypothetical protein